MTDPNDAKELVTGHKDKPSRINFDSVKNPRTMDSSKNSEDVAPTRPIIATDNPVAAESRFKPSRTAKGSEWYGSLELYRGISALLIVVYHVYQYMRSGDDSSYPLEGTLAHVWLVSLDNFVSFFFVLSAFLIGRPYVRAALHGTPSTTRKNFLFRRAVRIIPLNTIAILTTWSFRTERYPGDWLDLVEHLTFTQVFDNERIFYTIGPAWSVAIEVHFYLVVAVTAPLVCRYCQKIPNKEQRVAALVKGLAIVAIGSFLFKIGAHVMGVGPSNWAVWFGLLAKFDIFCIGLLLAVAVARDKNGLVLRPQTHRLIQVAGIAIVAVGFVSRSFVPLPTFVYQHSVTAIGFALFLAASVTAVQGSKVRPDSGSNVIPNQGFNLRRLLLSSGSTIGMISYSLYLWHEPIMISLGSNGVLPTPGTEHDFLLGVLIVLPFAVGAAWLSYWTIEYSTGMISRTRSPNGISRKYYSNLESENGLGDKRVVHSLRTPTEE